MSGRLAPAASTTPAAAIASAPSTAFVPVSEASNVLSEANGAGFSRFFFTGVHLPQVVGRDIEHLCFATLLLRRFAVGFLSFEDGQFFLKGKQFGLFPSGTVCR
jgi:hypothetical protein